MIARVRSRGECEDFVRVDDVYEVTLDLGVGTWSMAVYERNGGLYIMPIPDSIQQRYVIVPGEVGFTIRMEDKNV